MAADYRSIARSRDERAVVAPPSHAVRLTIGIPDYNDQSQMSHAPVYRIWQSAIVLATIVLTVWSIATLTPPIILTVVVLAALVCVASLLRIDAGEETIAFEASVVFGALIIFHDARIALLAVVLGAGAQTIYDAARRKEWSFDRLYGVSQLALSSFLVGWLYTSAVARDAVPVAKFAGYVLLVVGYLVMQLFTLSLRRYFESDARPVDFRRVVIVHGKSLILVTAIIAIEVMLYRSFGITGFVIGFLPVVIVAHAMRNEVDAAQQNADLLRRNRELSILTENSTKILSAETDEETLRRLMGLLSSLAKLKACAVVTWNPNPDVPSTVYRYGECLKTDQDILRWVDAAGFAQSAPSRAFVFKNDQRRFPLSDGDGIQVLIGIQTPEVIYGILMFETEDASILKAGSLNLLTLLVNQTALSVQDHLLRREMQEKNRELESRANTMRTVLDVSSKVLRQLNVDAAFTQIAHAVRSALGFEVVVFALRDTKTGEYTRRAQVGLDDVWDEMKKKRISEEQVKSFFNPEFLMSRSFYVPNSALRHSENDVFILPEDPSTSMLEEWHENDTLFVPLQSGEEILGYLSVREHQERKRPSTEKVEALEVFAVQAVTAFQLIRQYEEIERLTIVDSLTDAHNHRHFQQRLREEIKRHVRLPQSTFAMALLDIDNFKRINDTYGHPTGDEMLRGLVRILKDNKRETDLVARYGGEEFAVILPDADAASAFEAANRFRQIVADTLFDMPAIGKTLRMTVSIGVALCPVDGDTEAQLIARSDAALYHAKKTGKDRVSMAAEVIKIATKPA
jgi:diguanylate cyclase (GGDEF)-like protein